MRRNDDVYVANMMAGTIKCREKPRKRWVGEKVARDYRGRYMRTPGVDEETVMDGAMWKDKTSPLA